MQEIINLVSNQRKYDKFAIAYLIGMMDFQNNKARFPETYRRQVILDEFISLVHTHRIKYLRDVPAFKQFFNQQNKTNNDEK